MEIKLKNGIRISNGWPWPKYVTITFSPHHSCPKLSNDDVKELIDALGKFRDAYPLFEFEESNNAHGN